MSKTSLLSRISRGFRLLADSIFDTPLVPGAYEAASQRRRLRNWQPTDESIQAIASRDVRMLRRRSRDLGRNNPYVSSARETFVADMVGTGIKPSPVLDALDNALRLEMKDLWRDWCDECDADGTQDFYGLEALVAGAMFESGECFIRFRERSPDDGFVVPLQIQVLESDMCPIEFNTVASNGNAIINGVEFDLIGRRAAYWMYKRHPGDTIGGLALGTAPSWGTQVPVRVPAYQILHVFKPTRPGQVRGIPWTSPSIVRLWLLDQYDDAELDRKKTAAMYAGFIKSANVEDVLPEADNTFSPPGETDITLEPGTIQGLNPGEEMQWSAPVDLGGQYEDFQYRNLLGASAGMSASYLDMTGDLRRANYSTLRGAIIRIRRRIEMHQQNTLIRMMCRGVRRRFLDEAVLAGMLNINDYVDNFRYYNRTLWITPKQEWVDPQKDMAAEKLMVDGLFKARSDVIESMGYDPDEVDARILLDQQREDALGLRRGSGSVTATGPEDLGSRDSGGDSTGDGGY